LSDDTLSSVTADVLVHALHISGCRLAPHGTLTHTRRHTLAESDPPRSSSIAVRIQRINCLRQAATYILWQVRIK